MQTPSPKNSLRTDLANVGRGLMMGGADIIPGVSGGTMALILGVYERLVTALSHFDLTWLGHVRSARWSAAAAHIDLRFLVALGTGILIGVAGLAGVMHHLLDHYPVPTWSVLFGLIFGSAILVAGMVRRWSPATAIAVGAGAVFAYWLVGQLPAVPPEGYWYLFLCGVIAICAMILPGISGAFILVIMGMYFTVTGELKALAKADVTGERILFLAIFCAGCAIGLLSFSKLLRWLLVRHEAITMAAMCGILFGSLRKIWPFKQELTTEDAVALGFASDQLEMLHKYRLGDNLLPADLGDWAVALPLALVGLFLVLALDRWARRANARLLQPADHPTPAETDS